MLMLCLREARASQPEPASQSQPAKASQPKLASQSQAEPAFLSKIWPTRGTDPMLMLCLREQACPHLKFFQQTPSTTAQAQNRGQRLAPPKGLSIKPDLGWEWKALWFSSIDHLRCSQSAMWHDASLSCHHSKLMSRTSRCEAKPEREPPRGHSLVSKAATASGSQLHSSARTSPGGGHST